VKKPRTRKRQKLGTGYVWFVRDSGEAGYTKVLLTKEPNGQGGPVPIKYDGVGGWQKVNLIAEWR